MFNPHLRGEMWKLHAFFQKKAPFLNTRDGWVGTLKVGVPFSISLVVVIDKGRFFLSQKTLFSN
jgi:hypothetical protein